MVTGQMLALLHCVPCLFVYVFIGHYTLFGLCFPGKRPLADVWALDTAAKPYEWRKLEPEGEGPPPCMYTSVSMNSAFLD